MCGLHCSLFTSHCNCSHVHLYPTACQRQQTSYLPLETFWLLPLLRRFNWNPMESIVHAFVSFLLLLVQRSFLCPSVYMFHQVISTLLMGSHMLRTWCCTLTPRYHSLVKPTFHMLFRQFLFPLLLTFSVLVLYPNRLFHKCLNYCRIRWHSLHAFADAFNGYYKNEAIGTRNCRYFAGFYLFVRNIWTSHSNIWDSLGLTVFACIASVKHIHLRNVFNVLAVASLLLYPCFYICLKIILKRDSCLSRQLIAFAGMSNLSDLKQNACNDENYLPDRVGNPESYMILPEGQEDLQQLNRTAVFPHNNIMAVFLRLV